MNSRMDVLSALADALRDLLAVGDDTTAEEGLAIRAKARAALARVQPAPTDMGRLPSAARGAA